MTWTETFCNHKIIQDNNAIKITTKTVGLADARKPNNRKPLYRRVVIYEPLIYRMGLTIVCHPQKIQAVRRVLRQAAQQAHDDVMSALLYGVDRF